MKINKSYRQWLQNELYHWNKIFKEENWTNKKKIKIYKQLKEFYCEEVA